MMFRVSNDHTYHEFDVSSRDELLQELETLNARCNPIDPEKTYRIFELTSDGEILDQVTLQIPFQGKIDTILEQFGHHEISSSKKGILNFVQSIVPKKGSTREPDRVSIPELQVPEPSVNPEQVAKPLDAVAPAPYRVNRDEAAQEAPAQVPEKNPEMERLLAETQKVPRLAPESEAPSKEEPILSQDLEPKEEPRVTSPMSQVAIPPSAGLTDISGLSTHDLQREFIERTQRELEWMDKELATLAVKRANHLKLLESLKQLPLG